jgi:hypothetical protein
MRAPGSGGRPESRLHGVVVTFRRPAELSLTLSRLGAQDRPLERLVVVDNGPTPQAKQAVAGYAAGGHDAVYVPARENLGPAGGLAVGMKRISASVDESRLDRVARRRHAALQVLAAGRALQVRRLSGRCRSVDRRRGHHRSPVRLEAAPVGTASR